MIAARPLEAVSEEEKIVAELELLGIHYLSRQTPYRVEHVRPADVLLADLIQQPSARVRLAIIALLLAHPELAEAVPAALQRLPPSAQLTLRLFYTAAVWLQRAFAEPLRARLTDHWRWLPDWFSSELGLPVDGTPQQQLARLGQEQRRRTQAAVNWTGTYDDVAQRLLHQWELERQGKD